MKKELVEIKYMYWDGSNVERKLTVSKETKILQFIEICRQQLKKEYGIMEKIAQDHLILISNNVVLPHKISFFEIIMLKLKNKEGESLFEFIEEQRGD